jgi:hypothetical protein
MWQAPMGAYQMSTRKVRKWVIKRETLAKIEGLQEAQKLVVQDQQTAFAKITSRISELEKVVA